MSRTQGVETDCCLFLGGPLDGQWRMVRKGQQTYAINSLERLPAALALVSECKAEDMKSTRQHVYIKSFHPVEVTMDEGEEPLTVFVMKEKETDTFSQLVKGYRRPKGL